MHLNKILEIANPKQLEAIKHPLAPLMIIAGAGTGKTFTLENRIVYMIQKYNVDPKNILTITYTEKAANELKFRLLNKVGQKVHPMFIGTFHSFCYKLMKDFFRNNATASILIDQSEAVHMLLERYDDFYPLLSDEFSLNPKAAVIESFIPFFNRIRDELIDIKTIDYENLEKFYENNQELFFQLKDLLRIYPIFQKWKKENNFIDYNDMIKDAYNSLKNDKAVLNDVRNKFKHIIIDEFQDNNYALNEIARLISGKNESITVVGDDDQVIYSFRGANAFNILTFENTYKSNNQYKTITLETNYRSSQPILDLANHSIKNNKERKEKSLWSNSTLSEIKPVLFNGEKNEQITFISDKINQLKKDFPYKEMAILCRTHQQSIQIIDHLNSLGIPNRSSKRNLFNIAQVKDLLAWIQLIAKGKYYEIALFRILKNKSGYENAHIFFNKSWEENKSGLNSETIKTDKASKFINEITSIIEYFKSIAHKRSAGEIVWELCEKLKILKNKSRRYLLQDQYEILNISSIISNAQKFSNNTNNKKNDNIFRFNRFLEDIMSSGGLPSLEPAINKDYDAVTINTVHGVKGGEFEIVFLPFQRSASFPLNFKSEKKIKNPPDILLNYENYTDLSPKEHHYQEERRLFYVAITRAKNLLYILAPTKATSKFVKELPEEMMDKKTTNNQEDKHILRSELKIKYSKMMQDALSENQYAIIKELANILSIIDKYENNENYVLDNSELHQQLKSDLKTSFTPEIPNQISLSASAIETYLACPLKYRMSKIDKIPQTSSKPELVFGNIIHKVLQRFHEKDKDLNEQRALRLLNEEWQSGMFEYKIREEKFKTQGIEMLTHYVKNISKSPPNVIATELNFTFQLNDITIAGTIDRLDKEDGIVITDYKTSKSSTKAKTSLQLAIYSLFLEQTEDLVLRGIPEISKLYFLRDFEDPIKEHAFSIDELRDTEQKILEVSKGIRKKDFNPIKGNHCNWCDYKYLACPVWED
ncbi:ATP-dependent helicase [Candidatus Marinimicrobia bacterium]|nr:ATP-dependent helicase [Candidatus Neomarinimicrobiota bacterium]